MKILHRVIESYRPRFAHELGTEWAAALIYRPLSFLLTIPFLILGCSPTLISLLGVVLALSLPILAWQGAGAGTVAGLAVLFYILDCVDGNVARTSGRTSKIGAYVDFFSDLIFRVSFYAAIGLLADSAAVGWGLAMGVLSAWLALAARACRLYAERGHANENVAAQGKPSTIADWVISFASGLDGFTPVLLMLSAYFQSLTILLAYLLIFSFLDLALAQHQVSVRLK
jgi:phosphatidylglycerophosphate synthase